MKGDNQEKKNVNPLLGIIGTPASTAKKHLDVLVAAMNGYVSETVNDDHAYRFETSYDRTREQLDAEVAKGDPHPYNSLRLCTERFEDGAWKYYDDHCVSAQLTSLGHDVLELRLAEQMCQHIIGGVTAYRSPRSMATKNLPFLVYNHVEPYSDGDLVHDELPAGLPFEALVQPSKQDGKTPLLVALRMLLDEYYEAGEMYCHDETFDVRTKFATAYDDEGNRMRGIEATSYSASIEWHMAKFIHRNRDGRQLPELTITAKRDGQVYISSNAMNYKGKTASVSMPIEDMSVEAARIVYGYLHCAGFNVDGRETI